MNILLPVEEGVETMPRTQFTTNQVVETSFLDTNMSSPVTPLDFKKINWANPWSAALSKGLSAPLMNLPPLLFDWDKIPANYHHLRPPLYKNIKSEEVDGRYPALSEFSIESLTRKPYGNEGSGSRSKYLTYLVCL